MNRPSRIFGQAFAKPVLTAVYRALNKVFPRSRIITLVGAAMITSLGYSSGFANELSYQLEPIEVAPSCYALVGSEDYFSGDNGGYIVNTGFIVTDAGVVVIDTGPSFRFGEKLRQVITETSNNAPILASFITHSHPDHYLGNQAFTDAPIYGGSDTINTIEQMGEDFTVNMYRLVGDWMRGTESIAPNTKLTESQTFRFGNRDISLIRFEGHTAEDFAIFDETCATLYAGDLVFNARTLSTPHANIDEWITTLQAIKAIPFKVLVPGHGAISDSHTPIEETIDYLTWLKKRLLDSYQSGLDITEVMELPIPKRFRNFSLARDEYRRSVHNLYPAIEATYLPLIN